MAGSEAVRTLFFTYAESALVHTVEPPPLAAGGSAVGSSCARADNRVGSAAICAKVGRCGGSRVGAWFTDGDITASEPEYVGAASDKAGDHGAPPDGVGRWGRLGDTRLRDEDAAPVP